MPILYQQIKFSCYNIMVCTCIQCWLYACGQIKYNVMMLHAQVHDVAWYTMLYACGQIKYMMLHGIQWRLSSVYQYWGLCNSLRYMYLAVSMVGTMISLSLLMLGSIPLSLMRSSHRVHLPRPFCSKRYKWVPLEEINSVQHAIKLYDLPRLTFHVTT